VNTAFGAYQAAQTLTADPVQVLLQLFDGATRFLRRSLKALERGDGVQFAQSLNRAHAIIGELADSLDHKRGGEIATNLARLYEFMLMHLTQGLVAKSPQHVERVLGLLATLREAFEAAAASHGSSA
jgi:flagellar secretion chaperone FliS